MKLKLSEDNKHYLRLITIYTIILAVVYSFWMHKSDLPIWSVILVGVGFLLVGGFVVFLYLNHIKKSNTKEDISDKEENSSDNSSCNDGENKMDL